jgi:uncharacterized UPF0146 family protein
MIAADLIPRSLDVVLPPFQFFEPTEEFLNWLVERIKHKVVIEVGAGQGHLSLALLERGIKVLSIDAFEREGQVAPIVVADATRFIYPKSSVVLMARPSRGEWITETINRVLDSASEIYYIARPSRVDSDLFEFALEGTHLFSDAGNDEEEVHHFKLEKETGMEKFYLITWGHGHLVMGPSWMQRVGDKWVGPSGGGFYSRDGGEQILDTVDAEDWYDLDWSRTSLALREEGCTSGWVSPKGKFFPCGSKDHDEYAYLVLRKEVRELEEGGWARLGGIRPHMGDKGYTDFQIMKKLTPDQRNRLSTLGYVLEEE